MSLLETIPLEHVPATHSVHVAFYRDVSNAGFLQSQLLARNPDFEYAFINATTIVSRLHVLAAAYKALSVLVEGRLKSPNVHAETVLALSASNNVCWLAAAVHTQIHTPTHKPPEEIDVTFTDNPVRQISESYRRYGISEVKDIIVIKILFPTNDKLQPPTTQDVRAHLSQHVHGTAVPFTDEEIAKTTDWSKIKKYYKLNGAPALNNIKEEQAKRKESEMLVLGAMALRGV